MPPKNKPSELPPRFLFVNEDASTVTRRSKDPAVDREKQSHVQRHNFAKRQSLKQRASNQESDSKEVVEFSDPAGPVSIQEAFETFDAFLSPEVHSAPLPSPLSYMQPQKPFDSGAGYGLTSRLPTPPFLAASRATQPLFPGTDQILEKWAPPLIQHYNTVILPEKFYADTNRRPLGQTRHAMAIHADTAGAMSEPVHLYAFLASAAAHMLSREGKLLVPDVKEDDYDRVILFFKTKAMEHLRAALAMGVTHALVVDIFRLIAVAYFSKSYESANPHFVAMMSTIEALGGVETFGDYFQESNILLDWSAALKNLVPPRLALDWDPERGDPSITKILDSLEQSPDALGARMLQLFDRKELREDLKAPFEGLVEITRFHRWLKAQDTYEHAHYRYVILRHVAVGCQFLSLVPGPTANAEEESVRIALIFWTALTRSPESGRRCASEGISQLQSRLMDTDLDGWGGFDDLLLWIAVVGGLTARRDEWIDWFAGVAAKAARRIGRGVFSDFEKMEMLLTGFLYEPAIQREPLLEFRSRMRKIGQR